MTVKAGDCAAYAYGGPGADIEYVYVVTVSGDTARCYSPFLKEEIDISVDKLLPPREGYESVKILSDGKIRTVAEQMAEAAKVVNLR